MFEIFIVSIVTFAAAILTFFSGFGLGTILTPVMMIFFPTEIAIAFTGLVHFSNNIFKFLLVGKNIDEKILLRFGLPSVIAAFIGSYLLVIIDENIILFSYYFFDKKIDVILVKFLISILFIIFAIVDLIPQVKKINFDKKHLPVGGFLSGFFGGLSGNQGALRSAFLVKHGLEKSVFVATTVAISSLVDITRLSVYSTNFLNLNYSDFYQLGFFSVVSAVAGSFIGNKLLKKVTIEQIKKIVALLLILIGIFLLIGVL
ncbi:MAG: sulfite exporter TauE/SafE family protein [Flavobacteriaceae bacterium TMED206]|nr:MAG: sulfite exporter TauE/SafE family protein [Flavobacteriaceae bacterium TMED206]